ncbi:unnamed protein product [Schistosoma margrebowiei]|uniref:RRM domain-containing protein n=1 Tax=Schistosoma margrebowiei TaxID=48269 RepID=A0A3P8DTY2_9TREM|nr:unnamed protein product [Schistosoma margrebowiei]
MGSTIIVDGCPVVGPAKFELLKKFLLDKFSKIGPIVDHEFPLDNEKQTKGYIFITYENGKAASQAVRTMNNVPLDKNHTFQVTLLSDFERVTNVPTEWVPPPKQEYKDLGNLKSWLLNEFCRDQFAVVYNDGETGSVYWHTAVEPVVAEERAHWTDGWMRWSPRGTYLATMHSLGIILWGGEKFQRIGRFPHSVVIFIHILYLLLCALMLSKCFFVPMTGFGIQLHFIPLVILIKICSLSWMVWSWSSHRSFEQHHQHKLQIEVNSNTSLLSEVCADDVVQKNDESFTIKPSSSENKTPSKSST